MLAKCSVGCGLAQTLACQGLHALGRTRTCGLLIRSQWKVVCGCLSLVGAFTYPAVLNLIAQHSAEGWQQTLLSAVITTLYFGIIIICIGVPGNYLVNKLFQVLFPIGIFAIGEGNERYSKLKRMQALIGGALLTLMLGLVGAALQQLLLG